MRSVCGGAVGWCVGGVRIHIFVLALCAALVNVDRSTLHMKECRSFMLSFLESV